MSLEKVGKMLNDSTKNQNKTWVWKIRKFEKKEEKDQDGSIFFSAIFCVFFFVLSSKRQYIVHSTLHETCNT